jgi:hypothetical protein
MPSGEYYFNDEISTLLFLPGFIQPSGACEIVHSGDRLAKTGLWR